MNPPHANFARSQDLTVPDCEAIVSQVVDPDRSYWVEGWVILSLAEGLLKYKARPRRVRRSAKKPPSGQRFLFD